MRFMASPYQIGADSQHIIEQSTKLFTPRIRGEGGHEPIGAGCILIMGAGGYDRRQRCLTEAHHHLVAVPYDVALGAAYLAGGVGAGLAGHGSGTGQGGITGSETGQSGDSRLNERTISRRIPGDSDVHCFSVPLNAPIGMLVKAGVGVADRYAQYRSSAIRLRPSLDYIAARSRHRNCVQSGNQQRRLYAQWQSR